MLKKYFSVFLIIYLIAAMGFLTSPWANAATDTAEEQKLIEEEARRELKDIKIAPPTKGEVWSLRAGGWFTSLFRDYTDLDNDKNGKDLTSWILTEDLRLWSNLSYQKKYTLYLRIKHTYTHRDLSSLSTSYRSDYDGPNLDMGYLAITQPDWQIPIDLTLGKQYLFVGRGIAYSDVNYGAKYKTRLGKNFYLKTFASMADENSQNLDLSIPNYNKTNNRIFGAVEVAYSGLKNDILYGFVLIQRDKNARFPPETPTQSYRYNSQYYGLGLQSLRPQSRLSYWLEVIKEQGRSNTDTDAVDPEEKNIDAWAGDWGLSYRTKLPLRPTLEFEYAYGSGDKDRSSVTDTRSGGNRYGQDTNFLYFGSFFAGYALAPRLSNMHIYKVDCSLRPLPKLKFTKQVTAGFKYFLYRKDKKAGGVYDIEATESDLDIGREANAYLYWPIGKHITWSNRYGIFFPGNAYPSPANNATRYFYTKLTLTF